MLGAASDAELGFYISRRPREAAEPGLPAGIRSPAPAGTKSLPALAAVTLTVTASQTGAVRLVIEPRPGLDTGDEAFAVPGSARVYSLAQARAARAGRLG